MKRFLVIGDVHAKLSDLDECSRLIDLVCEQAAEHKPDYVVFLGDQYHNHSIVRVEVMEFWKRAFSRLALVPGCGHIVALVGNHDKGPGSDAHAMLAHTGMDSLTVVDRPTMIGGFLFLPHMQNEDFVEACSRSEFRSASVAFCHQTFNLSKYDSGFYAEDGVDITLCPQSLFVCGHIHTAQRIGTSGTDGKWRHAVYLGSPRWMSLHDANQNKSIRLLELSPTDGVQGDDILVPTSPACTPILALTETPDSLQQMPASPASVVVELRGPSAWISDRLIYWQGKGAKVRVIREDQKQAAVRESSGISAALSQYVDSYEPKSHLVSVEALRSLAKERLCRNQ